MARMRFGTWFCPLALVNAGLFAAPPDGPKPLVTIPIKGAGATWAEAQWMGFLPSGLLVVRSRLPGSADATVAVYDAGTGKSVVSAAVKGGGKLPPDCASCGVSPKGDWVVYAEGDSLRFLAVPPHNPDLPGKGRIDLPKGEPGDPLWVWPAGNGEAAFVVRGPLLFGIYDLEKWDLTKGTRRPAGRVGGPGRAGAVALNAPAGRIAVSTRDDDAEKSGIRCSTLGNNPVKTDIPVPHRVDSLALAPDGRTVAAGFGDGSVAWYDTATGKGAKLLPLGRFSVGAVAFHPGGKHLACGTYDQGVPNLFLIDVASGEVVAKLLPDGKGVGAVCFSPSGDRLAAFGASGEVTVWDAAALLKLQRD